MKYSFVFCLAAALVIQCSCRPQQSPATASPPPPETIMTDAESPSDVTEQVVFDEVPAQGGNQDDADAGPVTTDIPTNAENAEAQQDDAMTTISPAMMDEIVEANTEPAAVPVSASSQESTVVDESMPEATTVVPTTTD